MAVLPASGTKIGPQVGVGAGLSLVDGVLTGSGGGSSGAYTVSAAGTVQGDATLLAAQINVVTTVATGAGVILPSSSANTLFWVRNQDAADTLLVYPNSSAAINSLSTNAAFSLFPGQPMLFCAASSTQWYTLSA